MKSFLLGFSNIFSPEDSQALHAFIGLDFLCLEWRNEERYSSLKDTVLLARRVENSTADELCAAGFVKRFPK